jgi:hypothetical protein
MIQTTQTPFRSRHNIAVTERSIKNILADGTPRWVSNPREFKNWAQELYLKDKEDSDRQVAGYRIEGQDLLTDEKARKIHPMSSRDFIQKLRDNGVNCFTYQVQAENTPAAMVNTVGLWCVIPSQAQIGFAYQGRKYQYITWMDIPSMYEWSVLRVDRHELPSGEKYRGWRTVVSEMIKRKVFTEQKAHEIFGLPSGRQSLFYRKRLHLYRNGRFKQNDRILTAE